MAGALPALEQVMCVERTGRGLDDDQGLRERLQVRGQAGGCGDRLRQPQWHMVPTGGPTPQGPRFSISRRKGSDRGLNLPLSRRPAPGAFLHAGGTSAASVGHSPARSNFLARQRRLNLHPKDDSCACKTRVFADGNRADQEKNRAPFSMSCPGLGQVTVLPRKGLLLCVRTAERPLLRHPHPHGPSSAGAGVSGPAPLRQATGEDGALSPREKGDNQTPPAARAAR